MAPNLGLMDDDAWAEWLDAFEVEDPPIIIPDAEKGRKRESIEEREMRMRAQPKGEDLSSDESDAAHRASCFRDDWESLWSRRYGAFEDNSKFPGPLIISISLFPLISSLLDPLGLILNLLQLRAARIPSMRFTWNRASSWDAMYESALQIFFQPRSLQQER